MRLIFALVFFCSAFSVGRASTCSIMLESAQPVLTAENIESQVNYLLYEGRKVPYVDLAPTGEEVGSVMLFSGFSKNMNSWIAQANSLRERGYRVILFDQANVGRNLRENGIKDLSLGEGFSYDAKLAMEVVKKLRPQNLIFVGHSRGARVAAEVATMLWRLRKPAVKLEKLILASPYTTYAWGSKASGYSGEYINKVLGYYIKYYPNLIGRSMGESLHESEEEQVPGLPQDLKERALGYILQGTYPGDSEEVTTLEFIKRIVAKAVRVKVVTAEKEEKLTPLEDVQVLDIPGVEFDVIEGEDSHYWPSEHVEFFVDKIQE